MRPHFKSDFYIQKQKEMYHLIVLRSKMILEIQGANNITFGSWYRGGFSFRWVLWMRQLSRRYGEIAKICKYFLTPPSSSTLLSDTLNQDGSHSPRCFR